MSDRFVDIQVNFNIRSRRDEILNFVILYQVMQNLPENHQTLLFSATMPVEIEALAQVRCYDYCFSLF